MHWISRVRNLGWFFITGVFKTYAWTVFIVPCNIKTLDAMTYISPGTYYTIYIIFHIVFGLSEYRWFYSRKCSWKYRLWNGGHFVPGETRNGTKGELFLLRILLYLYLIFFRGSAGIFPGGSTLSEHRRILVWLSPRVFFADFIIGLSGMLFRKIL